MRLLASPASPQQNLWSRLDAKSQVAVVCGFAAVLAYLGSGGATIGRALVGGFGLLVFVLIAFSGRATAVVMIIVWLALLGFIRRGLIPFAGWADNDPLLLLSPAAAVVVWFTGRAEAPRNRSPLAALVAFLMLWATMQVFNPAQPSLTVAAQGFLFYFTPLAWFFAGRTLDTDIHDRVLKTVMAVDVVVATHGLYQSFIGFLPFELTWLNVSKQGAAVFLPGFKVRPFSTLVSPQEYGLFLTVAIVIIWAQILHTPATDPRRRRRLGVLLLYSLVALFFQGARGTLVFALLALAVMAVVRARSVMALFGVVVLGVAAVLWIGGKSVPETTTDSPVQPGSSPAAASAAVSHQLSGLTDPGSSTAGLHLEQAIDGFRIGLADPIGFGTSTASIASVKADGAKVTPENDVGNTTVALGLPGGLALMGIVVAGFRVAGRANRLQPNARHLAWLGMLVASLFQWLNGGLYAVSTIIFLTLGGLSRGVLTSAVRRTPRVRTPRRAEVPA